MWLTGWNYIVGLIRQESAAATAMVQAFIALGIAFAWWSWTPAQTGAVVGIVAALLGMFVRSQVTPLHTLADRSWARGGRGPGPRIRRVPGPAGGPAGGRPGGPAGPPGGPGGPPGGPAGSPEAPGEGPASGPGTRPMPRPVAEPDPWPGTEPGAGERGRQP
jgi:hypothetical protein